MKAQKRMELIMQALEAWFARKEVAMFSSEDLKCLDLGYFSIIMKDTYDVTVMSRNIRHYWYQHNPEYSEKETVIIYFIYTMWAKQDECHAICMAEHNPCDRRYRAFKGMTSDR